MCVCVMRRYMNWNIEWMSHFFEEGKPDFRETNAENGVKNVKEVNNRNP